MAPAEFSAIALRDRAVALLTTSGTVDEEVLLAHVYGGAPPVALRPRFTAPLLEDERLERNPDGRWSLRHAAAIASEFSALALVATGPTPGRGQLVRVTALRVAGDQVVERFDLVLNPQKRVPRYVAERAGVDPEVLNDQPTFGNVVGDLKRFLGDRPILAQDVHLTWAFLAAESRRHGLALAEPILLDANDLATSYLSLKGKPTLALVAAELGIGVTTVTTTAEEARVLALIGSRLLAMGAPGEAGSAGQGMALRRGSTARAVPDEPGVYVMRDAEQQPLYVGKARRLRSRVGAYVNRPLGPTRRLEGLVGRVEAVDTTQCPTDLEALIFEDREIRRLQPRFNTVRQQRTPRYWIRLPKPRVSTRGRPLAQPRLELSTGLEADEAELIGPFRNEMLADQARQLARDVFGLDALRGTNPVEYGEGARNALAFLRGDSSLAEPLARTRSLRLLRKVLAFDVASVLLPADPRQARYVVVRPTPAGLEGFLLDHATLLAWTVLDDEDPYAFAQRLLAPVEPRTGPEEMDVVLRWFGAQRPPTRLILLPDDALLASDAIEDAVYALTPEA
ncbi:MAG: hypothetical protein JOZ65_20090 [Chloroflexi bacterium]|nr:hypothetical protein [Chloroflexota bacterium]